MNEKEIDALKGRQLDLVIEKYVFGNEKPQKEDNVEWERELEDGTYLGTKYIPGSDMWYTISWPPEYHTLDYLAFQVVDKIMEKELWRWQFELYSYQGGWWAEFIDNEQILGGKANGSLAKTRMLAICHSALKVICNEQ